MADSTLIVALAGIGGTFGAAAASHYTTRSLERARWRRDDDFGTRQVRQAVHLTRAEFSRA